MANVTPQDVRSYLSGFCGLESTDDGVTDQWIQDRLTKSVLPYIQSVTGYSFSGIQTFIEYKDGNGQDTITLDHNPVLSLTAIEIIGPTYSEILFNIANFLVVQDEGIIKWRMSQDRSILPPAVVFPRGSKNIKVTYTAGYAEIPDDLAEAITLLMAEKVLGMVADQTGGGSLTVQSWARTWGELGMYTNIRRKLAMEAMLIIRRYTTGVAG